MSLFEQKYVLDATSRKCPIEVLKEVKSLWEDYEAGNDHYYIPFDVEEYDGEGCEELCKLLKSYGIKECLLHYWW